MKRIKSQLQSDSLLRTDSSNGHGLVTNQLRCLNTTTTNTSINNNDDDDDGNETLLNTPFPPEEKWTQGACTVLSTRASQAIPLRIGNKVKRTPLRIGNKVKRTPLRIGNKVKRTPLRIGNKVKRTDYWCRFSLDDSHTGGSGGFRTVEWYTWIV